MRVFPTFAALLVVAIVVIVADQWRRFREHAVVIERTEYHKPTLNPDDPLKDDVFDAQAVPTFDPARTDSRSADGWSVNLSAAVTKLDLDLLLPDVDADLLKLRPSYLEALRALPDHSRFLPSVNLIDGKAKQFDDGFYAALEEHWFQTRVGEFRGDLDFFQRLAAALPSDSRAAAYVATGLELAEISFPATNQSARSEWKARFESRELNVKPIGFYSWTLKLQQCYRVHRFFQMDFPLADIQWMRDIVDALRRDSGLRAEYQGILARWARLSNAPLTLTVLDLVENPDPSQLRRVIGERRPVLGTVSLIPPGTSRESELTRRLFSSGFLATDDVMRELVRAIRSGDVDLRPTDKSGWYDYQVYALETLLVSKRADESEHLLLSGTYKRRMLQAFQALMTKRRETQALRSPAGVTSIRQMPLVKFSPRLRLEPAPTYYLRMARSYRFLDHALRDLVGETQLAGIHGLTKHGPRKQPLPVELIEIQRLFYGCYALSAEDIGLAINLAPDELQDLSEARNVAEKWLGDLTGDSDLGEDTRVIVPVAEDLNRRVMSNWATLGVRFARLKTSYHPDAPPRVKADDDEDWKPLSRDQLSEATYLILIDEFASVQIPSSRVLTRDEFRKICDDSTTSEEIVGHLRKIEARN